MNNLKKKKYTINDIENIYKEFEQIEKKINKVNEEIKNKEDDIFKKNILKKQITFIDLFCGIGGFHKGLSNYYCVMACDINKFCIDIYEKNYKIKPYGDIFNLKEKNIPDHDIICAGFPCQPFSSAGKKLGMNDDRSKVYDKLLSIIKYKKPKIFLLENVKNLTIIDNGEVIKKIISDLTNLGYNVSYSILNTYNFGLPQNRERLFIIGTNNDFFPKKIFSFDKLNQNKDNISLKKFLKINSNNNYKDEYINNNDYIIIDKKYQIRQKSGLVFCGYIKGNIRKTGVLPNTLHLSRVHKQPNRIYHIDGVNPTLSSSESSGRYYIYDNIGVRKLSIIECYDIMGFNNFIMHTNKIISYKQIGNSVSPVIITYIRNELIRQNFLY